MIDTNLRSVKRHPGGASVLTKTQLQARQLCQHCARLYDCETAAMMRSMAQKGTELLVKTCRHYSFPIPFRDTQGLDRERFNTIRMGTAFYSRLRVGDRVGLLNGERTNLGTAIVKELHCGPKDAMLMEFAAGNHLLLGEPITRAEAAIKMARILRNSYGKLVYENNDQVTVVVLQRE